MHGAAPPMLSIWLIVQCIGGVARTYCWFVLLLRGFLVTELQQHEKQEERMDPAHAHKHHREAEAAEAGVLGLGGYALHEMHEANQLRKAENAYAAAADGARHHRHHRH